MENKVLISIVTVSYNAVLSIEQTIQSVINQTYPYIEYIIIDGGSKDGTVDIIKKYEDKIAYWVSEPDKGIYDAMNKGIRVSRGYWINFMNSGDRFFDFNVLDRLFLEKNYTGVDIIYGDRISEYSFGSFYQMPKALSHLNTCFPIFHQSTFVRSEIMKKYEFDLKYRISGDYAFFYKAYYGGKMFLYINLPISICEVENGISTLSKNQFNRLKEDAILRDEKIGFYFYLNVIKLKIKRSLRFIYCIIDKSYTTNENRAKRLLKSDRFKTHC